MSRPAKPIDLHLVKSHHGLTQNEIEARKEAEKAISFADDKIKSERITPPSWLSKDAKKVYRQLIKEYENNDLLVNVDTHLLAMFADAYTDYITMTEIIERDGIMMEHTNKSGNTNSIPHPLYTKKKALFDQMNKIMSELGMSPQARAKLAIPRQIKDIDDKLQLFGDKI